MGRLAALVLVLAGCGRLGFAPLDRVVDAAGAPPVTVTAAPAVTSWNPTRGSDGAVAVPGDAAAGDVILFHVTWAHNYGDLVVPAGWSVAAAPWTETHCRASSTALFYRTVASGDTTYPVTCNGFCTGAVFTAHDVDAAQPIDATGATATTTETIGCGGSASPQLQVVPGVAAHANDLVLLLYGDNNDDIAASTQALPATLTTMYSSYARDNGGENLLAGQLTATADGSADQTVTVTNENLWGWTAMQVALRPGA